MKPRIRAAGCPVRLSHGLLGGESELVFTVRTYWFPGSFNEANPESSTRYTGTSSPTSKLVRPLATAYKGSGEWPP